MPVGPTPTVAMRERMARSMKFSGAIFDVDGTLLDSMSVWASIGENYLRSIGVTPKEDINETIRSMSFTQSARHFQTEYHVPLTQQQIADGINHIVEQYYWEEAPVKPGVPEFLELLQEKGVKMCVATATDRYLVEAALKRVGIRDFFGEIFTCTSVGHGKDEPVIFEEAGRFLAVPQKETIVFEDALHAAKTAKRAGFTVAAIYDRHEPAGRAAGPRRFLYHRL